MKQSGFTLLELIVTMLIIGVLAIAVLPRFADRTIFDRRGFYDETLSILRYAQKSAIAQRRNVCVTFTGSTVTLTIAGTAGVGVACTRNLAGPKGDTYTITAKSGVYFINTGGNAATPANFTFNALGEASIGQTFRISDFSENITVEQGTGYVHS